MAVNIENTRRRIVPRWREFQLALQSGELDPTETRLVSALPPDSFILKKKEEWTNNRTLLFATDFLGVAYVMGHPELAIDAAKFVLEPDSGSSTAAKSIAAKVLRIPMPLEDSLQAPISADRRDLYEPIRRMKKKRIDQPRNAFVWADLARLYTILGLQEQAKKAMQIAYYLAPLNRYILRSAARLELHLNQPEKAHYLLRNAEITKHDPWLMATEIAISSILEKSSKLIKPGMRIVDGRSLDPFQVCELSSALASVELWKGNSKKAKKLFAFSLQKPNDNALAQAVWATRYVTIEDLLEKKFDPIRAFEAKALMTYFEGKWKKSLEHSRFWLSDEPFSRRPYIHMSFLTSEIFEDHISGTKIIESALRIIPKEPTLLNNLAFSLIHLGKLEEAKKALSKIDLSRCPLSTKICALATSGLLEYRSGRPNEGRDLYHKAIQIAYKESQPWLKARAMIYLAREELLANSSNADNLRQKAINEALKIKEPSLKLLARRLERLKI